MDWIYGMAAMLNLHYEPVVICNQFYYQYNKEILLHSVFFIKKPMYFYFLCTVFKLCSIEVLDSILIPYINTMTDAFSYHVLKTYIHI